MMAVIANVELERKCRACEGYGAVKAPEWIAYWEATGSDAGDREAPELPDCPEEIDCGECDGSGSELTAAGRQLLAFLERHGYCQAVAL